MPGIDLTTGRRLGRLRLVPDPVTEHPPVSALGFDPVLGHPTLEEFQELIKKKKGTVKGMIMDQAFSAGVGNVSCFSSSNLEPYSLRVLSRFRSENTGLPPNDVASRYITSYSRRANHSGWQMRSCIKLVYILLVLSRPYHQKISRISIINFAISVKPL